MRDDLGRITQQTEIIAGQTRTVTYGYDLAGRLTEVTQNSATIATYTYDANGNRLSYSTRSQRSGLTQAVHFGLRHV